MSHRFLAIVCFVFFFFSYHLRQCLHLTDVLLEVFSSFLCFCLFFIPLPSSTLTECVTCMSTTMVTSDKRCHSYVAVLILVLSNADHAHLCLL